MITTQGGRLGAGFLALEAQRSSATFLRSPTERRRAGMSIQDSWIWPQCTVRGQRPRGKNAQPSKISEASVPLWNIRHQPFLIPDVQATSTSSHFLISASHGIQAFCNDYLKNSLTILILRNIIQSAYRLWSTLSFPGQKIPSEQSYGHLSRRWRHSVVFRMRINPLSILISYNRWWENCVGQKLQVCVSCL